MNYRSSELLARHAGPRSRFLEITAQTNDARDLQHPLPCSRGSVTLARFRHVRCGLLSEAPPRAIIKVARMIALLRGTLVEKSPNQAVVDVAGVGYDVTIPVSTYTALPNAGAEVRLRIHTHVREDLIALFGFGTTEEKQVFEKLIGVSGIGPKLAVTVLSGLAAPDLIRAIRNSEIERLVRIPGVGKKTAERMVLELKDKLLAPAVPDGGTPDQPALSDIDRDVLSALLNLGCARPAAEAAVRKARTAAPGDDFEPLFRRALEFVR